MKTRMMKKKFRRVFCASMAAVFLLSDMIPVASAQDTATETLPAGTERIIGFESVNPVEYYELENGGSYQDLKIPQKIRAVVELPEDIQLSTFKEEEPPEQKDELLPKYEYSHTVDKLMLETANETLFSNDASSQVTEDTSSQVTEDASSQVTEDTSSQVTEDTSSQTEADSEESSIKTVTTEEAQQLLEESSKISYNSAKVYSFTDSTGKTQYRVYGSVNEQDPQWYAVDEEGTVLGVVEELDANWDFSKLDSTVAGKYQVKVQLPENYVLNQDVEIAYMQIMVAQENGEQASSENKDGSLPEVLPVSYILARSAANALANTATYPVTIEREGIVQSVQDEFNGGTITNATVPVVDNYILFEEFSDEGMLISNGASLRVTVDGVTSSYNNVTAMYSVTDGSGTPTWFYTTTLSEGRVAWQVPKDAELVFRYVPDPNALDGFTKVTITSDDWKDGSASGNYTEGMQDYESYVPVGENLSVTVDLPSLYTAYKSNIEYTNIEAGTVNQSNSRVQLSSSWGPSEARGKFINDTVTFTFNVPQVSAEDAETGVVIKLKFLSYMREFYADNVTQSAQSVNETLWLRINQDYPSLASWNSYYDTVYARWGGYRAIRVFAQPGQVEFRQVSSTNTAVQYTSNSSSWTAASKIAYQNLGPDSMMSDMGVANSNWQNLWNERGNTARMQQTAWSPSLSGDSPNPMQTDAWALYDVGASTYAASKEIGKDNNDDRTLFFTYTSTLTNYTPYYGDGSWNPMRMSGHGLPTGIMIYTVASDQGYFVPLETQIALSSETASGSRATMAEVEFGGMKIKVERISYGVRSYTTNLGQDRSAGKTRDWTYTVQVQGATGYIGVDFITAIDTQNTVSLTSVSSNVEKVEILSTLSEAGDVTSSSLQWQTITTGMNRYAYQLSNNYGNKYGDFYDGVWGITYSYREGGLPIRIKQKEGYGIPYLKFADSTVSDPKQLIAGLDNITLDSTSYSSPVTITNIGGQTNKPVRGRMQNLAGHSTSTEDGVVVEYLFGFKQSNESWFGWGNNIKFSVEADPQILAVTYDLNGGTAPPSSDITTTTTTTTRADNYYVTTPSSSPTPPTGSNSRFVGWQIIKADGTPLTDKTGATIYLQPNQTISTTDETYFPETLLDTGNGEDYPDGSGYFNAVVVTLKAIYTEQTSEGQIVTGRVTTYTQNQANTNTNDNTGYIASSTESATAPSGQNYYVIREESYTDENNVEYRLNNDSLYSGVAGDTIEDSNIIFGKLYYDKVINLQYNINTTGKPNDATAPTNDTNKYTTVDGNNNSITLQKPTGSEATEKFEGWQITYDNNQTVLIPPEITTLVLDGSANTTSSVDKTMTIGGNVAQSIYNAGTVELDAVWNTLLPIASGRYSTADQNKKLWNDQYKQNAVTQFYSDTITIEGQFKYDFATRTEILAEWGQNGSSRSNKASDTMAEYLDWALYGLKGANGTVTTWSLRGDDSGGRGISTILNLEDADTDGDGYAMATIKITIPKELVTYDTMSTQQFYLFAWNAASNKALNTAYDAVVDTNPNSPFSVVMTSNPHYDYSGDARYPANASDPYTPNGIIPAVASEFISYGTMVPRGIETADGDYGIATGEQIQWKNSEGNTRTFTVQFKYDTAVPWGQQIGNNSNDNGSDNNRIRIVVGERNEDTGAWTQVQRYNPDGTFGNTIDNSYSIQLIEPTTGSDTFTVEVTINNMTANATNFGKNFIVTAFNNQNGESDAPSATARLGMNNIVGDITSTAQSIVGTTVPAVESQSRIYPKGVQVVGDGGNTLSQDVDVQKDSYRDSEVQTATFTYDSAVTTGDTTMSQWYDPSAGNNYRIGFYKQENNGWTLVDSATGANDTQEGNYITNVDADNGQVTVNYKIPASENTQDTEYRLVAFYTNIDGNNNIQATSIDLNTAGANNTSLATVNITLNPVNTYNRIESFEYNSQGHWNSQTKVVSNVVTNNEGDSLVLEAKFRYDIRTRDEIMAYWDDRTNNATTDAGMGYYLNWVMYGYNPTTSKTTTWLIREQVQRDDIGGIDPSHISVALNLNENDNSAGAADDNMGLATITVTIDQSAVTYSNLDDQILYLFVWNDATNRAINANYTALRHDADTSEGQSPYSSILSRLLDKTSPTPHWDLSPSGALSDVSFVANAYWYINVRPTAVQGVEGDRVNNNVRQTQTVTINQDGTATIQITAKFRRDTEIPWDAQYGNGNTSAVLPSANNARDVIRVAVYRQDYSKIASNQWTRVSRLNPDGTFGTSDNGYSVTIADDDDGNGTFTVTLTKTTPLAASYESFDSKYMIVAYNYSNYSGNMSDFLPGTNGWQTMTFGQFGTTIPINTITVNFTPAPMTETDGGMDGHQFEQGKNIGQSTTVTYTLQGNIVSWINSSGGANEEMRAQFDPEYESSVGQGDSNIIVTLWRRGVDVDGNPTGDFTFVDSYQGGAFDAVAETANEKDYIQEVNFDSTSGNLQVIAYLDADSDQGEYRVYAWYRNSIPDDFVVDDIEDASLFGGATPNIHGYIPYGTAKLTPYAPESYIEIPSLIVLQEGTNGENGSNVLESVTGADLSTNYAGHAVTVRYNQTTQDATDKTQIPEIQVDLVDNRPMTQQSTNSESNTQLLGIYFEDGYKNNTSSTYNSGLRIIGTLSFSRQVPLNSNQGQTTGQTAPTGSSITFWLNTPRSFVKNEEYTTTLLFHFNNIGMNTNSSSGTNP